jgi:uncharacterized protein YkwD
LEGGAEMSKRNFCILGSLTIIAISAMLISFGPKADEQTDTTTAVESVSIAGQDINLSDNKVEVKVIDTKAAESDGSKESEETAEYTEDGHREIGYQADMAYAVYSSVNKLRTEAGLNPLRWSKDTAMLDYSTRRAVEIIADFSHDSIGGEMDFGENIAEGYTTVDEVMEAWMNSEGHRYNIMCDYYKTISVSVYYDGYSYYWVQNFDVY